MSAFIIPYCQNFWQNINEVNVLKFRIDKFSINDHNREKFFEQKDKYWHLIFLYQTNLKKLEQIDQMLKKQKEVFIELFAKD